jgi:hypothetical protein
MKLYEEEYIDEKIIRVIQMYIKRIFSIFIFLFFFQIEIFQIYVAFYLILLIKLKDVQKHVNFLNQLKQNHLFLLYQKHELFQYQKLFV